MKNYIKPELEVLNFQAESIMVGAIDLNASNVTGGFMERENA